MAIITNDGWFGSKKMCQQHFDYGRLRAIEHRRSVVRCSNTGISGFIDPRGKTLKKTNHLEETVLKGVVKTQHGLSFYTQHGDYLAIIALWMALPLLLFTTLTQLPMAKIKRNTTSGKA